MLPIKDMCNKLVKNHMSMLSRDALETIANCAFG